MEFVIDKKDKKDIVVIPVFSKNKKALFFNRYKNNDQYIKEFNKYNFTGETNEYLLLEIEEQKYFFTGIPERYTIEDLRIMGSIIYENLTKRNFQSIFLNIPKDRSNEIKGVIEGLSLTEYEFTKYKNTIPKNKFLVKLNISHKNKQLLKEIITNCKNIKLVRDLVNENSYVINPLKFSDILKEFAKKYKLRYQIFDEKKILKENLNLIYFVGKGSEYPPRFGVIEYLGNRKNKFTIGLVGKGVTFDTGGYDIKSASGMLYMKRDMTGAATIYGVLKTIVELNYNMNIIAVFPLVENAISERSFKPGEIIKSHNGLFVEVTNTDAEGRLILADSLSYLTKNYNLDLIIDVATLTGYSKIALGNKISGMFGNTQRFMKELVNSSIEEYEKVWELPIINEHREALISDFADIKNTGGRYGGASIAAAFLEKFIGNNNWIHLDISGPAFSEKEEFYIKKGGTGATVRLLLNFLKKINK